jgi:hypothetical protein
VPEGDVLLLQPAHTLVERGARAVDFATAAPRAPPAAPRAPPAAAPGALAEGDVLALQPCHEAVF